MFLNQQGNRFEKTYINFRQLCRDLGTHKEDHDCGTIWRADLIDFGNKEYLIRKKQELKKNTVFKMLEEEVFI